MNKLFNGIYKNKKVLITGDTGFKGAWLSLWLKELGAKVFGYALNPPTDPSLFGVLKLKDKIIHIDGDVRDYKYLRKVINKYKPEIVFHLAAQAIVRSSYQLPRLTYETNIMGTINLLDAVSNSKTIKSVVVVTSDKCYKNIGNNSEFKENDPMGGDDPYSASKGAAELIIDVYRKMLLNPDSKHRPQRIAVASARAGNVIGGGDWAADRLIPDCVRAISENKEIIIRNPGYVRNWQYVLEPLSGYLWLGALMYMDSKSYNQGWNFGSDKNGALSVEKVLQKIIEFWGKGNYKVVPDKEFPESRRLTLNIAKAKSFLKWKPVYLTDEALKKTVSWYKMYLELDKQHICDYTLGQINEYIINAREKRLRWSR